MRSITLSKLILTSLLFYHQNLLAFDITFLSRNMPSHCTYVFQVESEVKIILKNLEVKNSQWELVYLLKNAFSSDLDFSEPRSLFFNDSQGESKINFGFESMSTAESFLFREMRFFLLNRERNIILGPWNVSFGREFGEPCYNRSERTPFRVRELNLLN